MAVQPELEGFFEDGVADMYLEDLPCAGLQWSEHEVGDCFVSFGVVNDG